MLDKMMAKIDNLSKKKRSAKCNLVAIAALLIFHGVIGRVKATILKTIYKLIKLKGHILQRGCDG